MSDHQVYLDALDASLVAIERWLSGIDTAPEALDALLAAFSAEFTMILTDGREVDHDGTRALFESSPARSRGCASRCRTPACSRPTRRMRP